MGKIIVKKKDGTVKKYSVIRKKSKRLKTQPMKRGKFA